MFTDPLHFVQSVFRVSPDGRRVAVTDLLPQGRSVSILDLDTGRDMRIAEDKNLRSAFYPLAWSSDGRYLAYSVSPDPLISPPQGPELWVVGADGSNARKVYTDSPPHPSGRLEFLQWLPGGDAIFFVRPGSGTEGHKQATYQVVSAQDGTRQVLFIGGGYLELVRGGRFLAFYNAEDDRHNMTRLAVLAYDSGR
jgi:Tol biopolymer transport system component